MPLHARQEGCIHPPPSFLSLSLSLSLLVKLHTRTFIYLNFFGGPSIYSTIYFSNNRAYKPKTRKSAPPIRWTVFSEILGEKRRKTNKKTRTKNEKRKKRETLNMRNGTNKNQNQKKRTPGIRGQGGGGDKEAGGGAGGRMSAEFKRHGTGKRLTQTGERPRRQHTDTYKNTWYKYLSSLSPSLPPSITPSHTPGVPPSLSREKRIKCVYTLVNPFRTSGIYPDVSTIYLYTVVHDLQMYNLQIDHDLVPHRPL